jgi:hypothetical protein
LAKLQVLGVSGGAARRLRLGLEQAAIFHPGLKFINPEGGARRTVAHAKAVAPLFIKMHFQRALGIAVRLYQAKRLAAGEKRIIQRNRQSDQPFLQMMTTPLGLGKFNGDEIGKNFAVSYGLRKRGSQCQGVESLLLRN